MNLQFKHEAKPDYYCFRLYQVNTGRDFLSMHGYVLMWECAHECVRVWLVCTCGACARRDRASSPITTRLLPLFINLHIEFLVRFFLKKQQKMPVVSGIIVTHISTSHRYLLLNPRRKHSILIVNCSLWYRVNIMDTCLNLGVLAYMLHSLCRGSLAGRFNGQHC